MLFALVFASLVAYVLWTWVCLERNVRRASSMGVPIVRLPIDSHNVLWQVVEANLWTITDALPIPWLSYPESIRFMRRGWHFFEKAGAHERYGPIWVLVSGASINVHVSDPNAVRDVLTRRRDFVRVVKNYSMMQFLATSHIVPSLITLQKFLTSLGPLSLPPTPIIGLATAKLLQRHSTRVS